MAAKFIPTPVILLVLFCLVLMREISGCSSAYACFDANGESLKENRHRKMLSALKEKKTSLKVSTSLQGSSRIDQYGDDQKPVIGELRKVPTGPDPLHHHNIGNPIRPETP